MAVNVTLTIEGVPYQFDGNGIGTAVIVPAVDPLTGLPEGVPAVPEAAVTPYNKTAKYCYDAKAGTGFAGSQKGMSLKRDVPFVITRRIFLYRRQCAVSSFPDWYHPVSDLPEYLHNVLIWHP